MFFNRLVILHGVAFLAPLLVQTILQTDILQAAGGVFGGDFLAFYTASKLTLQGQPLTAYDFNAFDDALKNLAPSDQLGMMWQYPPIMFLVTAPLALVPYKVSFWLWMMLGMAAFAAALNRLLADLHGKRTIRREALWLLLMSPICVGVFINGQVSLFTAALLMTALYRPKTHWLIAGLAAGLLTIKPQLGLLIPIAYLAIGAWRPALLATGVAILIHASSVLLLGPDSMTSFLEAVSRLQADVTGKGLLTPPTAMTTLFGQLMVWGVSSRLALWFQGFAALALAAFVFTEWVRFSKHDQSSLYLVALTSASAIVVTHYAYAYEMAALAPAALYLALQPNRLQRHAMTVLSVVWLLLIFRSFAPSGFPLQFTFIVASGTLAVLIAARPTLPSTENPEFVSFQSAYTKGSHEIARASDR